MQRHRFHERLLNIRVGMLALDILGLEGDNCFADNLARDVHAGTALARMGYSESAQATRRYRFSRYEQLG